MVLVVRLWLQDYIDLGLFTSENENTDKPI